MSESKDQLKLQVLLAEYQYVSGLIPYYRSVETTVLSTMAVILAALAGFIGSLNSTSTGKAPIELEGNIIALVPWLMLLFIAIEVTALLRILRASVYIKKKLYKKLNALLGEKTMRFEKIPSLKLIGNRNAEGLHKTISDFQRKNLIGSNTILWGMGLTSLALAALGNVVSNQFTLFHLAGYFAALISLIVMTTGLRLAKSVERHAKKNESKDDRKS
jgi:hypothetical protein